MEKESAIEFFRSTEKTGPLDKLIAGLQEQATGSKKKLPNEVIRMLEYFRVVELSVMVRYIQEIRKMPSYLDGDIREFGEAWEREETRHGVAIEEYLRVHGHICESITKKDDSWRYFFFTWFLISSSWVLWRVSPIVHMISGMLNEAVAKSGYRAFMKHASDPELRSLISLIQAEEVRHLKFYEEKAFELINKSSFKKRWASRILRRVWQPVGSGNADIQALADDLLTGEGVADGFFSHVESNIQKIKVQLPEIRDLMMSDLRTLVKS